MVFVVFHVSFFGGLFCIFFFKQKTAYDMRISDWSSDVCSSDLVVAGSDAAPVLQAAEHDLDAAAAPVPALVVSDRFVAGFPTWDAGLDALGFQRIPEPVGVIAAVAEQPLRLWEIVQQRGCTGVVADLPGSSEEPTSELQP